MSDEVRKAADEIESAVQRAIANERRYQRERIATLLFPLIILAGGIAFVVVLAVAVIASRNSGWMGLLWLAASVLGGGWSCAWLMSASLHLLDNWMTHGE